LVGGGAYTIVELTTNQAGSRGRSATGFGFFRSAMPGVGDRIWSQLSVPSKSKIQSQRIQKSALSALLA